MPKPIYADPDGVYRFGPDDLDDMVELIAASCDVLQPADLAQLRLIRKCREIDQAFLPRIAFDRNRFTEATANA